MAVSASLFISIEGNQNGEKSAPAPKTQLASALNPSTAGADWWKNDPPGNKKRSATQNASLSEQRKREVSCCLATVRDDMVLQGRDGELIQSLSRP